MGHIATELESKIPSLHTQFILLGSIYSFQYWVAWGCSKSSLCHNDRRSISGSSDRSFTSPFWRCRSGAAGTIRMPLPLQYLSVLLFTSPPSILICLMIILSETSISLSRFISVRCLNRAGWTGSLIFSCSRNHQSVNLTLNGEQIYTCHQVP
jgi:hypothetical protein